MPSKLGMRSLISVIIPVYNVEPYIRQCLDSVVDQTYRNLEIIIVDDGSPDNCGAICDEYAAKDKRIQVIHKANEGLSAARNDALNRVTGNWILFVDSDDWLELDLCETAICAAQSDDTDVLIYDLVKEDIKGGKRIHAFPHGFVTEDPAVISGMQLSALNRYYTPYSTEWCQGFPWDKLFRAELILKNRLSFATNVRANEDVIFALHAFQYAKRIGYISKPLYHYRKNQNSIGHKFSPDRVEIDREIYKEIEKVGKMYDRPPAFFQALDSRIVENTCLCAERCFFGPKKRGTLFDQIRYAKQVLRSEPIYSAFDRVDRNKMGIRTKFITLSRHHNVLLLYGYYIAKRMHDCAREMIYQIKA